MKNAESTAAPTTQTSTVAEQGAHRAPEKASSKKRTTRRKGAPKSRKTANGGKARATAPKKDGKTTKKRAKLTTPRAESKGAKILEMIARAKGATLVEIMKATDWQAHSVRGFISTASTKHGFKIDSAKNEAGDRVYRSGG